MTITFICCRCILVWVVWLSSPVHSTIRNGLDRSADSDYLILSTAPSSLNSSLIGVYTKTYLQKEDYICELRGHAVPTTSLNSFDLSDIISFKLFRADGQNFTLVEDTLCSKIQMCAHPSGILPTSCEVNAILAALDTGKLFVIAIHDISPGSELFIPYNEEYVNIYPEFDPSCHYSEKGCVVSEVEYEMLESLGVLDTDYLSIFLAPSLLPVQGAGLGVFARHNIPAARVVCVTRGKVYNARDKPHSSRLTPIIDVNGEGYVINMDNACGYMNDIVAAEDIIFSKEMLASYYSGKETLPTLPAFTRSVGQALYSFKLMIITIVDVAAGAELFNNYGVNYWLYYKATQDPSNEVNITFVSS